MIALGMVELNSIPKGIEAADAMLKAADVQLTGCSFRMRRKIYCCRKR